jgi:hypothetical protein
MYNHTSRHVEAQLIGSLRVDIDEARLGSRLCSSVFQDLSVMVAQPSPGSYSERGSGKISQDINEVRQRGV